VTLVRRGLLECEKMSSPREQSTTKPSGQFGEVSPPARFAARTRRNWRVDIEYAARL
jgi:hypothetical protein